MNVPAHIEDDPDSGKSFYAKHKKIYPQSVRGTFRRIKWIVLVVTLGIYYFTPFIRWDRGPGAPDQAVLIDLPGRRFYFFFIEIWPQEIYYVTGLLILAALLLFLMNAVAGRVWCGYLCPQTVWTDLFLAIERWTEGDRRERMHNDAGKLTPRLAARKTLKHALWLLTAWWTGGAWVLYFADAPTLVYDLATLQAPFIAYLWIGILTFTTYALAGHLREQVCLYMCPWPRIQAALTDEYAYNVTYRFDRGEPRMSAKKADAARQRGEAAGDCVDCHQCVVVCPTGVDIRGGPNLGCIQCGLCIDACDSVMERLDRPTRLISYDTDINIEQRLEGKPAISRVVRPRTLFYSILILVVGAVMVWSLSARSVTSVNVLHDRNPEFVVLSDGGIRNAYTVRILNKRTIPRNFAISVDGLTDPTVEVTAATGQDGDQVVTVAADQTREVRVIVSVAEPPAEPSVPVTFVLADTEDGSVASATDNFRGPGTGK
ncbi:MAG: cytochrome c oxidase accessory protein CcoG [Bauldia sp.]|uniref:cytochrome c oxidase accessory protein CcoG n=1 Tax=Bauldia sp. TaxID=2575872 RepID=UPI001DC56B52|nr:cytochrome c oxidase accessory protein CcoG [Bauldia sp.]MCB1494426.1 cytochrome c oxidase accessory protein CcoG [Bauldia sp.]